MCVSVLRSVCLFCAMSVLCSVCLFCALSACSACSMLCLCGLWSVCVIMARGTHGSEDILWTRLHSLKCVKWVLIDVEMQSTITAKLLRFLYWKISFLIGMFRILNRRKANTTVHSRLFRELVYGECTANPSLSILHNMEPKWTLWGRP